MCSARSRCTAGAAFTLQTAAPILTGIVRDLLLEHRVPFEPLAGGYFVAAIEHATWIVQLLSQHLNEAELRDIRVSGNSVHGLFNSFTIDQWTHRAGTAWFDDAFLNDRFTAYFQPIVDVRKEIVFAHECLIRLLAGGFFSGAEIIEAAQRRGDIHLFDSYARRLSVRMAGGQRRAGTKVFVNFMPSSIYDPEHCMRSTMADMDKTDLAPTDVVFEVVESDKLASNAHLRKICDYYRARNFGFALDDVGTGSNSLQLMCDLHPEYIKLDKSLVANIAQPMYRATIGKIVEVAEQFGIQVIGEGVEDAATMIALSQAGVALMQGYYFARPAPTMTFPALDMIRLAAATGVLAESPAPANAPH